MKKEFYSNGKLLITGEYAVLDGALSLALPTKFGQFLTIETNNGHRRVNWKSLDHDGSIWFEASFSFDEIINFDSTQKTDTLGTLLKILHVIGNINHGIFDSENGYKITTRLTFPRLWGLGTSSTLINNLATWAGANPYELLQQTFGGSGYDIACSQSDSPITYKLENKLPVINEVCFNPGFANNLVFVYLNKKQDSQKSISAYNLAKKNVPQHIAEISDITSRIVSCNDALMAGNLFERHENIISKITCQPKVKDILFSDFKGGMKSLGAWGGDFILAIGRQEYMYDYFQEKGYGTIIPYHDMVIPFII